MPKAKTTASVSRPATVFTRFVVPEGASTAPIRKVAPPKTPSKKISCFTISQLSKLTGKPVTTLSRLLEAYKIMPDVKVGGRQVYSQVLTSKISRWIFNRDCVIGSRNASPKNQKVVENHFRAQADKALTDLIAHKAK